MSSARAPSARVPGPRLPAFAQASWFASRPYAFLESCRRRYGRTFRVQIPGDPPRVVTSEPEYIKKILALPDECFRYESQSFPIDLGRRSILFQNASEHDATRTLLMPPLMRSAVARYREDMLDCADAMIDRWAPGETRTLAEELRVLTIDVFVRSVLGVREPAAARELGAQLIGWSEASLSPSAIALALVLSPARARELLADTADALRDGGLSWAARRSPWGRLAARKLALLERLQRLIDQCRRDGDEARLDVIKQLTRARYGDGAPMRDADIRDQLVTLMVGGYETTTQTLCWTLQLLLLNPESLRRARAEAAELDETRPLDATSWIAACVREALRLRPVAPVVNRQLGRAIRLGPYELDPGTILWPCSYLAQREPELWPDARAFQPARWLTRPSALGGRYFPWGGGRRRCLGMAFATEEVHVVLARVLRRTCLELREQRLSRARFRGVSLGAADGVRVRVRSAAPRGD